VDSHCIANNNSLGGLEPTMRREVASDNVARATSVAAAAGAAAAAAIGIMNGRETGAIRGYCLHATRTICQNDDRISALYIVHTSTRDLRSGRLFTSS
jgi:hypothetical protein